ncbi:hypothetical protein J437_LFUL012408 [Ladona fulva]|uniref:Uncharacterized protein n=1 Tax=Ladona fulva TaxID=123851 RepID=A0A8K0KLQ8_LADFU|nr:hypothetical protein J437_LFUL012408 [Ladona fulva]
MQRKSDSKNQEEMEEVELVRKRTVRGTNQNVQVLEQHQMRIQVMRRSKMKVKRIMKKMKEKGRMWMMRGVGLKMKRVMSKERRRKKEAVKKSSL